MFQIYSNQQEQRAMIREINLNPWSFNPCMRWSKHMTNLNCMFFSANMIIGRRVKIRVILNQILTRRDTQTLCFLTIFNRRSNKYKYKCSLQVHMTPDLFFHHPNPHRMELTLSPSMTLDCSGRKIPLKLSLMPSVIQTIIMK